MDGGKQKPPNKRSELMALFTCSTGTWLQVLLPDETTVLVLSGTGIPVPVY